MFVLWDLAIWNHELIIVQAELFIIEMIIRVILRNNSFMFDCTFTNAELKSFIFMKSIMDTATILTILTFEKTTYQTDF